MRLHDKQQIILLQFIRCSPTYIWREGEKFSAIDNSGTKTSEKQKSKKKKILMQFEYYFLKKSQV